MPLIRENMNRGRTQMGWLDSFHTFSFGSFHDPKRMGVRNLRVINEDRVIPGAGFGKHQHSQMDILTYVLSGALRHEDSMGNTADIRPGEFQLMSAGAGVTHSEINASPDEPVHFLQIWIVPDRHIDAPTYASIVLENEAAENRFTLIAGPTAASDSLSLLSDTRVFVSHLRQDQSLRTTFSEGRAAFLHLVSGRVEIGGETLTAGDGVEFENEGECTIVALQDSELLLFDLP